MWKTLLVLKRMWNMTHCDHVNDFPAIFLAKCNSKNTKNTKKVNHLHDNNVNTKAKPRSYRVMLLDVPLNWAIPSYGLCPGGKYCPWKSPGNSKEHPTLLLDTSLALYTQLKNLKHVVTTCVIEARLLHWVPPLSRYKPETPFLCNTCLRQFHIW